MDAQQKIREQVTGNPVVLYMKGTPQMPQCGFSALAVQVLQACGVTQIFTVNVLAEPEIREGIKHYANWPTIPQLYVNGEFVGGADIVKEMYQSGELHNRLKAPKQQAYPASSRSARSQPGVGQVEPLDQDAEEAAVELAAAGRRGTLQVRHADAHDRRCARRGAARPALVAGLGKGGPRAG